MKKLNLKYMLLVLGVIAITGCKPPTKTGVRAYSSARTDNATSGTGTAGTMVIPNCTSGQSNIGTIYGQTNSFEVQVKNLLSAATNPADVGTISSGPNDNTGVRFQGVVKLDATGNVVLNQSKIVITVYDSLWFENPNEYPPIAITITGAKSGQFNRSTGVGSVTFEDSYGSITLQGTIKTDLFTGTVSFINTKHFNNETPLSGTLGAFAIASCGMVIL